MTPAKIKSKYEKRILAIMNSIKQAVLAEENFIVSGPDDIGCDDFRWGMYIQTPEQVENDIRDEGVDISFIICESEHWDGEENGVNFMVDIVSYGGGMLGGLCPYNYTDNVWVSRKDPAAIEKRFNLMEKAEVGDIPYLINEFFERKIKRKNI